MKRILSLVLVLGLSTSFFAQKYHLLVGTYTNTGKSEGIYSYDLNMKTAVFNQKYVVKGISNPSYLAITPDKKFVYSVNESQEGSAVNSFCFNKNTGKLVLINRSFTKSKGPCYISVTEKHVFTANYGGGSISVFGRKTDGSLTAALQVIQHIGNSVNTERQGEPHVHQVLVSPDQKCIIANDLGTDKVAVYKYHPTAETDVLTPFDTLMVKQGSGPRHAAFSKDGSKIFLAQEIDGTVSVLNFKNAKLKLIQETTVDKNDGTINRTADIHLSADERFLYVTNRGNANNITCFFVSKNGMLTFKQQISTEGNGPRNFVLTPDGQYILVAHQFTDNITIFKRDGRTGLLTYTGKQIKVGAPVCLKFY